MRNEIKKPDKYAKRALKAMLDNADDQAKLMRITALMKEVGEDTVKNVVANRDKGKALELVTKNGLRAEVVKRAISEGMSGMEADRLYNVAEQIATPFVDSAHETVQSRAVLNSLTTLAMDNLFEDVYDKDGNVCGTKFSYNTMNAISKIEGIKLQFLTKLQSNLISAQKETTLGPSSNEFAIADAEKDQLVRYLKGEYMDNPELVDILLDKSDGKDAIEIKNFHENS